MSAEIAYWDCDRDVEDLRHETRDDAFAAYLDAIPRAEWPETLEVHGWARMPVSWPTAEDITNRVVVEIDEELGDPNGARYSPGAAVLAAAEALLDALRADYVSWACARSVTETVDVRAWIARTGWRPDNRPALPGRKGER